MSRGQSVRRATWRRPQREHAVAIPPGLRRDYVSAPASGRGPEPSAAFPSYFDTSGETVELEPEPPPPRWKPHQSSVSRQGCQSPRLSRLQQQVTQFKLLKLAQNQGDPDVSAL